MLRGRVIRSTGAWYNVKLNNDEVVEARLKGKIRLTESKSTNPIAVGDYVLMEKEDSDVMIVEIEKRFNYIIRQSPKKRFATHILAANLDQAFVLVSMSAPRTSSGFIDRFLITAEAYHIPTVLVFNKQDILSEKDRIKQEEFAKIYADIGYEVRFVSAIKGTGIKELREEMKDKTTLLCGHSGVGKSTLANAIDPKLDLRTKELSEKHNKGLHTTTYAELFDLPFGGEVIDIPGIKEFGVIDFNKEEVSHYFPEMKELINECKFNNCLHINEPSCKVKLALYGGYIAEERYKNYFNIIYDIDSANFW